MDASATDPLLASGSADLAAEAVDAALAPFSAALAAGDLGQLLVRLGAPLTAADGHVRRRATAVLRPRRNHV